MADGGVLAGTCLAQAGIAADGRRHRRAAGDTVQVEHTELGKVITLEVGVACNGPQRIGAGVAEKRCIRLCANTEAVQHDQKYTFCHDDSPNIKMGL